MNPVPRAAVRFVAGIDLLSADELAAVLFALAAAVGTFAGVWLTGLLMGMVR